MVSEAGVIGSHELFPHEYWRFTWGPLQNKYVLLTAKSFFFYLRLGPTIESIWSRTHYVFQAGL